MNCKSQGTVDIKVVTVHASNHKHTCILHSHQPCMQPTCTCDNTTNAYKVSSTGLHVNFMLYSWYVYTVGTNLSEDVPHFHPLRVEPLDREGAEPVE